MREDARRTAGAGLAVLTVAVIAGFAGGALAHKVKSKTIELSHPWVRAMPSGVTVTAGYAKITNTGAEPDSLIGAALDGAAEGTLHAAVTEGDATSMRSLKDGIELPAGATVTLSTGGAHIMFTGVAKPLEPETYVPGSMTFKKAGKIKMEFYVEPLAEGAGPDAPTEHKH